MTAQARRRDAARKKTKSAASWTDDDSIRGWGNEALAVILFAFALFLTVTVIVAGLLLDFNAPEGSALASIAKTIGPFGRGMGMYMVQLLGWCALVPVAWFLWLSYACWELDDQSHTVDVQSKLLPLGGALVMLVGASALANVFWGEGAGGTIGTLVAAPLLKLFGGIGAIILLTALFIAAVSLATRQSIGVLLSQTASFTGRSFAFVFILAPIYSVRYLGALLYLSYRATQVVGRGIRYGWSNAFSAPTPDEKPLPKPSRRRNEVPRSSSTTESEIPEFPKIQTSTNKSTSDGFALGIELETGSVSRNGTKAPVQAEEPLEVEVPELEEEPASHVVVRRKATEYVPLKAQVEKRRQASDRNTLDDEAPPQGDFSDYQPPSFDLLTKGEIVGHGEDDQELLDKSRQIESKLRDFNILGRVTEVHPGPVITLFEFEPAPGVKVGKIAALQDDLAMSLRATSIRIIAPIPKKGTVGIEVPNRSRDMVRLREVLENKELIESESTLNVPLGKDTYGDPVYVDIAQMPHLLMAGATGTGKSVSINALLISLLYKASPAELGLILIDPKILELSVYEGIPHLKVPVVTIPKQAKAVLDWAIKEMERRYRMMQKFGVRNIDGYNAIVAGQKVEEQVMPTVVEEGEFSQEEIVVPTAEELEAASQKVLIAEELKPLPKIVIVVDELADLMLTVGREVEEAITRLAQKARAAGIHLILATQRPSVDVITGLIKANFPARLSFRVTSRIDSRTILDSMGAERLLGKGDMLFLQPGASHLRRIHGAFISDSEVQRVVEAIKKSSSPCYDQRILELCEKALREDSEGSDSGGEDFAGEYDPLYDKAVELVVQKGQASTSMVQRVFRIGYNRAARIIEMMERDGVIGPMDGVKPREVLVQGIEE